MTQVSLGLIETVGLVAAINAADAAVKSANVELVGYELTRGGGMATVKVRGDVGAVKAAVAAAAVAASGIGRVVSATVIARPAQGVGGMIGSRDTVGAEADLPQPPTPIPAARDEPPHAPAAPRPDAATPQTTLTEDMAEPEAGPDEPGESAGPFESAPPAGQEAGEAASGTPEKRLPGTKPERRPGKKGKK